MSWLHPKNIETTKDIIAELLILDSYCIEQSITADFIIVGGALLVLTLDKIGLDFRPTSDIDIAKITVSDEQILEGILSNELKERINTRVEYIMIPNVQEIIETNEFEAFNHDLFENIKPYTASPELLIVLKAISDRSIDMNDILKSGLLDIVNAKKTIRLIEEYQSFSPFSDLPDAHWYTIVKELKKRV